MVSPTDVCDSWGADHMCALMVLVDRDVDKSHPCKNRGVTERTHDNERVMEPLGSHEP